MDEIKNPINLINKEYKTINLVTFEEWLEDSDKLSKLGIGVILDPSNDVGLIKESLDSIELIVLDFRNFDDGRGYSQAYFLSKRWKFKGEIVGINAHLDQLQFMIRSGITSYQLLESYKGFNEEDYSSGFSICYQAAANNSGLNLKY
ncbi:MAG: DUF934 domain-containing protein [SAR86 cluster bacterium]|jgi:uncharacterized protein (DUF934 family)|nr:DUF934 domain-containing protein [Candidatus Pseudothioglobus aerophilus]MBT4587542.1 DUF934 domain-containing protein [Gammaproteobacteria bacterium]MDO7577793.1 DUF934 domain-containing protein [SAR86 cluster bacterium]MDP0560033.1 DUF934 domain-containing protein [Candidatus Thioglobus sp.]MBT4974195.1 DUF934 domain-containing protein [Gammaproteobacteria bacterium]